MPTRLTHDEIATRENPRHGSESIRRHLLFVAKIHSAPLEQLQSALIALKSGPVDFYEQAFQPAFLENVIKEFSALTTGKPPA